MTTSILIVTFDRDAEFLSYCLRTVAKFASGFQEVVVAAPHGHRGVEFVMSGFPQFRFHRFAETPGKGFLHHMLIKCMADVICGTDTVLHLDSDCWLTGPMTPETYLKDGKIVMLYRSYEQIRKNANHKDPPWNPLQLYWQVASVMATCWTSPYEVMLRHPLCYYRTTYEKLRERIQEIHGIPLHEYIFRCRAEFPTGFAEFTTLGATAWERHKDRYCWVDGKWGHLYQGVVRSGWSHRGIKDDERAEIEKLLA